ncbi:zinc finger BED domain-containing protein 1-like [Rhizophagus clarus]|uniref:Zinc finger BED domain-containing protein 1-like n=1 Tax=Rhizophagus clarus TaxID=94130 RepID=A0A8H3LGH9_9GLOM|nr:zinc finger BED domain-containing protein 1-like [Rhizophagus clarus]
MLKVIEKIGKNKFIAVVSDAEAAMQSAKKKVMSKYLHIMAVRCIAHYINLVTKNIISIEWAKKVLQKCQKIVSFFHDKHRTGDALPFFLHPKYKASCFQQDIFKNTILGLYKSRDEPFNDPYVEGTSTPINWWSSLELKKGEDPIKKLVLKMHEIMPHNADCERVFSYWDSS